MFTQLGTTRVALGGLGEINGEVYGYGARHFATRAGHGDPDRDGAPVVRTAPRTPSVRWLFGDFALRVFGCGMCRNAEGAAKVSAIVWR